MAFVFPHPVSTGRGSLLPRTGRRISAWLCRGLNLTAQERADLYVSRMALAVCTAAPNRLRAGGRGD